MGGRSAQSGGFSGSTGQWCSGTGTSDSREGTSTASTCIPHLSKQAVASGHGALAGVSQHAQGLDLAGAIIFSQSLMAPAASSVFADAIPCADSNAAAVATGELRGVSTSAREIKTART